MLPWGKQWIAVWSVGKGRRLSADITPFRVDVSEAVLEDLRERLRRTRWPERETVEDWSQGVPLAYVQELCLYWAMTPMTGGRPRLG
jgi:hypothetical protein